MAGSIVITGFKTFEDQSGDLVFDVLDHKSRNVGHWDIPRWWYNGRTIYEACARVNNTSNDDVLYIASSTNFPKLKIEFNGSNYTFDSDGKREHIDRILIKTSSDDIDIQVPLRGIIGASTGSEPSEPLDIAPNGGANWVGGNTYQVGETVYGKTAVFTGGTEPITYRWRIQTRPTASDSWASGNWTEVINAKVDISHLITEPGQIRLQSQAQQAEPRSTQNSFTGGQNVVE